jgi:hypothetical protein
MKFFISSEKNSLRFYKFVLFGQSNAVFNWVEILLNTFNNLLIVFI